jgi:hypothetical protein
MSSIHHTLALDGKYLRRGIVIIDKRQVLLRRLSLIMSCTFLSSILDGKHITVSDLGPKTKMSSAYLIEVL